MQKQSYQNHLRFYYPHHFVFYPVLTALVVLGIRQAMQNEARSMEWLAITAIFVLIGWLSFMTRQHYALTLQNRMVRMEMRLRYYQLTQQRLEDIENKLSFSQLAALRFASDDELPGLVKRTLNDSLSPDAIKKQIKHWVPDTMRV